MVAEQVEAPPAPAAAARPFRPTLAGLAGRGLFLLAVAYVALVWYPGANADYAANASLAAIYAMIGISLNILIGYTGQLSLGHQGFLGAGALTAAYLAAQTDMPFWITLLGGLLAGTVIALVLGLVALRITGLYLALITLVFGLTAQESLFEIPALTNQGVGQPADRPEFLLVNYRFFLFCVAALAVVLYVDYRLTHTKTGRALLALRENERVAEAFGINVTAFKLVAFMISGAIVGLAGALFAYKSQQFASQDYTFQLALTFVLMTVVGGLNSRVGVVVGSCFFALLRPLLESWHWLLELFSNAQYLPDLIGALLLVLTLVLNPGGIAQQIRPITRWLSGKRFTLHDEDDGHSVAEGSSVRA